MVLVLFDCVTPKYEKCEGAALVPLILIQDARESELEAKLSVDERIQLMDVLSSDAALAVPPPQHAVPDVFAVINVDAVGRQPAVMTGLLLRNAGHQVFLSCAQDYQDLMELMIDRFGFVQSIVDKDAPFRTELLVTDRALEMLGDVKPIVDDFERRYISKTDD